MKTLLQATKITLFILSLGLSQTKGFSQVTVTSTTGYTVTINAYASRIITSGGSCQYGYTYNVEMKYSVSFAGSNIPSSLYVLQGTIGCSPGSSFFDLPNNGGMGTVTSANNYNSASNCGTATPGVLRCNIVTIEISGPGISYRTVSFSPTNSPLEVKLTSFDAKVDNNKVKLNWTTASEENNDYFTIERSADGIKWDEIKKVKGAGTTTDVHNYESIDASPLTGTSYYRLKQTDFGGATTYSGTKTVTVTAIANNISIFPVPNAGNTINITGITDYKNHELTVISANGAILYDAILSKSSVELPTLKPGLYIIRLADKLNGEAQNLHYVKL